MGAVKAAKVALLGLLAVVFLLSGANPLWSAEGTVAVTEESPIQVKEIVISAEKVAVEQSKVTQKIDVYTEQEILNRPWFNRNLTEIFQYTPGAFINTLSRVDANWGSYGGLGPKYSTYLLDGLPIDSFVDPMSLDYLYLERAEMHRGPASIMYSNYMSMDFAGNQAPLAGIANLITKERITRPLTLISLGGGNWNTLEGRLYHQGRRENLHYFIGGYYEQSDYKNYGTTPSWLNMINSPDYKKGKAYFKVTYFFDPDRAKVSLFAHHTQHSGDFGRPNRGYDHQYDLVNAAYQHKFLDNNLVLNLKAGYRYYDRSWEEDNYPVNLQLREKDGVIQHIVPADLSFSWRHWGDSLLTVGTDFQFVTYRTYAKVSGVTATGNEMYAVQNGAYLEEKVVYGRWVFRAGGRYAYTHHHYDLIGGVIPEVRSKSWHEGLWSAGIRFNALDNLAFFANGGSSYVVPSAKSIGGTLRAADRCVPGRNGQLPNPGLRPESGIGSDVGVEFWPLKNLNLTLRGFLNVVDDVIVENVVCRNPSQSQSVNAGDSRSLGLEAEVNHYVNRYVAWFANFTYLDTKVNNDLDPAQDDSKIPFVPDWLVNVGLTVNLPVWEISISPYLRFVGHYFDSTDKTSRQRFGYYGVFNAKVRAALFKSRICDGYLNVDFNNITNRRYVNPWQFQDPGFNFLARLELQL